MSATLIPDIDATSWAYRLISLFPKDWTSAEAKQPGGKFFALMRALGTEFERIDYNLIYAFKASRIETAIDAALDSVAADYFGAIAGFPADISRAPGEPDASFRTRIKASLLLPAATRQSMIDLLIRLTGETPRVMEPWCPGDNGSFDFRSYIDVDTVENPSRIGNPSLRYQGFIESTLPTYAKQGSNNPVYAIDMGACMDSPTGYVLDPDPGWWLTIRLIDNLINKTKVFGTTAWRRYRNQPLTRTAIGATQYLNAGAYDVTVDVMPAFAGIYTVLAIANWNTGVYWVPISNRRFKLMFQVPAPSGGVVYWMAAPISMPGAGYSGVPENATSSVLANVSQFPGKTLIVTPSWNTAYWLSELTPEDATIDFAVPAPQQAKLSSFYFDANNSGLVPITAESAEVVFSVSTGEPYQIFVLPTWNTTTEVIKQGDGVIRVVFGTPPAMDEALYWGVNR